MRYAPLSMEGYEMYQGLCVKSEKDLRSDDFQSPSGFIAYEEAVA